MTNVSEATKIFVILEAIYIKRGGGVVEHFLKLNIFLNAS